MVSRPQENLELWGEHPLKYQENRSKVFPSMHTHKAYEQEATHQPFLIYKNWHENGCHRNITISTFALMYKYVLEIKNWHFITM